MTNRENMLALLCDNPKRKTLNVKFCRGFSDSVPEETFCGEISKVLFQFNNLMLHVDDKFVENVKQIDTKHLALI